MDCTATRAYPTLARLRQSQITPPRHTFSVDSRNENLPEERSHQSCANEPGRYAAPGFFVAQPRAPSHSGRTQSWDVGTDRGLTFHCFRIVIYNEFCNSNVLPARCLL